MPMTSFKEWFSVDFFFFVSVAIKKNFLPAQTGKTTAIRRAAVMILGFSGGVLKHVCPIEDPLKTL